jgi:DNA-binding response OmpR family regulator
LYQEAILKAKILVIDDDTAIGNSLKRVLTYEGFEVQLVNNGRDGLTVLKTFKPELVILDVVMSDISGIEVCQTIRKASLIPILFISARDEVYDRVLGLEKGGDDYLVKPFAFEELIARVKVLLRRNTPPKMEVLQIEDLILNKKSMTAYRNERAIELSATEYQLLLYLMTHPHQVLSKEQILERVWGYNFCGESNIVEVYIRYLRNKLEQNEEMRLIHTVRGVGYVLGNRR